MQEAVREKRKGFSGSATSSVSPSCRYSSVTGDLSHQAEPVGHESSEVELRSQDVKSAHIGWLVLTGEKGGLLLKVWSTDL